MFVVVGVGEALNRRMKSRHRVTKQGIESPGGIDAGKDLHQSAMFSYLSSEERVPAKYPLRPIRVIADVALAASSAAFDEIYVVFGRPSIAPEQLLRSLLLQVLYTIRSEGMVMEQLECNLLFRWLVGLNMDEPVCVRRYSARTGIV